MNRRAFIRSAIGGVAGACGVGALAKVAFQEPIKMTRTNMKNLLLLMVLLSVSGCGGWGGQGISGKADHGGTVTLHVYIHDGGTDFTPLYKPKGQLIQNPTTQPSE